MEIFTLHAQDSKASGFIKDIDWLFCSNFEHLSRHLFILVLICQEKSAVACPPPYAIVFGLQIKEHEHHGMPTGKKPSALQLQL
jgi:hypothetical protein